MSNAVMPLAHYKETCDAIRQKTGCNNVIKSGDLPQEIGRVFNIGQLSVISQSEALKGFAQGEWVTIKDISPVEHDISVNLESDTITDYSSVKLQRLGKNLVNSTDFHVNRSITITLENPLPAGTYTLSGLITTTASTGLIQAVYTDGSTSSGSTDCGYTSDANKRNILATKTYPKAIAKFNIYAGFGWNASAGHTANFVDFMIEKGSIATEFEPYIEPTEYTANADGTVSGIKSLCPSMTLTSDTEGVIITAEYIKDIDKAFEERLAEIEKALVNN